MWQALSLLQQSGFYFYCLCWVFLYAGLYVTLVLLDDMPKSTNPYKSPTFMYNWGFATRALATLHATLLVIMSMNLIRIYGLGDIWDYNFYLHYPDGVDRFSAMNAFMAAYLTVDASFNILELLYAPTKITLAGTTKITSLQLLNITHHLVGALSMWGFITFRKVHFNSLYYSMTEISTIPLHGTWAIMTLNLKQHPTFKIIFILLGALTWLLFLTIRIIGSAFLWIYIISNLTDIWHMHLMTKILGILGNATITILNIIWFIKLTHLVIKSSGITTNARTISEAITSEAITSEAITSEAITSQPDEKAKLD